MSQAERLLDLLQALRKRRAPAAGADLAEELDVSLRTLYRDMASLRAMGAPIEGEAGVGFVLRPGVLSPPLMFTPDELDALALGAQMAARRGDSGLRNAARNALAKIQAAVPEDQAEAIEASPLPAAPAAAPPPPQRKSEVGGADVIRQAIHQQAKLVLAYRDRDGAATRRTVWPIALGYFVGSEVMVGWCELRGDFRCFRLDRIKTLTVSEARYAGNRKAMLKRWKVSQGITEFIPTDTDSARLDGN